MASVWSREQMDVLIDAIKEEQCLYNTKCKNYHNKHYRNEALIRVYEKVKCVRENLICPKECQTKFLNMRNMYNVENKKIRESKTSGAGADDIYVPSLWYFKKLQFLEEYYVPRASKSTPLPITEETCSMPIQSDDSVLSNTDYAASPTTNTVEVPDDNYGEQLDLEINECVEPDVLQSQSSVVDVTPRAVTTAEGSVTPRATSRKRKGDSYIDAVEAIAQSLKQTTNNEIDTFIRFIGSELNHFKSVEHLRTVKQKIMKVIYEELEKQ